jgi:hypothetical protein
MRLAILAIAFIFVAPVICAGEAEQDLQLTVEKVWDTRATADWPQLKLLIRVKSGALKDAKRKKIQLIRAEDNLGNDLRTKDFNNSNEDFSVIDKIDEASAFIMIDLRLPPDKATHIKKIEGILELYIPDFDSKAKLILPDFSQKLKSGFYFQQNILAPKAQGSSQSQKGEISLHATYGLSTADDLDYQGDIVNIQIVDKDNKVIDVVLIDKEGNEIIPKEVSRSEEKTNLRYRFYADPTQIADAVVYLRTYKAVKIIPIEYGNIPLP